jgi:hypothetical protein
VAQEKRLAEQRFSDVLGQIAETASQLEDESRNIEVEGNAMRRSFAQRSVTVSAEVATVERKQQELDERHQQLILLLAELESKSKFLSSEWQKVLLDRQALAAQRCELEREELRLGQMADQLDFMKHQIDHTHYDVREAALRSQAMSQHLDASRDVARDGLERIKRHSEELLHRQQAQHRQSQPDAHARSTTKPTDGAAGQHTAAAALSTWMNPNRLPLRVLSELKTSLGGSQPHRFADPVPSATVDRPVPTRQDARHHSSEDDDRRHDVDDRLAQTVGGTSSYNFTNLVGISDAETTSLSQQTTATS